jgi:hypothetical protein
MNEFVGVGADSRSSAKPERAGWLVLSAGLAGCAPGGAVEEVIVVEVLTVEQFVEGGIAFAEPCEETEVSEALDAGREDDEEVGFAAGWSGEGVSHRRWDDDEVALVGDADVLAGEDLDRATEDVEQLGGVGVVVGHGAIGADGERDPLRGERAASSASVGEETHGAGWPPDDLGVGGSDDDGFVARGK